MNPSYPNQEQHQHQHHLQHNSRGFDQGAGASAIRDAPMGYGFDGVIPLEHQQQQAYLANLNAPFMYQQQQPQSQTQQSQHYYPAQKYDDPHVPHYRSSQFPQQFQAEQQAQPVHYSQYYQHQPMPPQYTQQQQRNPNYLDEGRHLQPAPQQTNFGNAQPQVQRSQHLPSQAHSHQTSHSKVHRPQQPQEYLYPQSLDGALDYANKPVHTQQPKQQPKKQHSTQGPPSKKIKSQHAINAESPVGNTNKPEPATEHRLLLLSLADQYISQARLSAHLVISDGDKSQREQYYKLIATGLACYEAVLKKSSWLSSPRQEAMARLRYATILHEETENDRVVEETLAKGIAVCERNKLMDLKYSMQHLLARAVFVTKPKAAFKALDRAIAEAKANRHVAWIYAFHLLRASLLMHNSPPEEMKNALTSLQAVSELARSQRDPAVCAAANVAEALLHLRLKQTDWHESLERALASARAQLMSLGDQAVPQIGAQIHILDVASVLELGQPKAAEQKRKAMLVFFDSTLEADWSSDGTFMLPMRGSVTDTYTNDTCGIFAAGEKGKTRLRISWLDKMSAWTLAYMFNGIVNLPRANHHEQPDAEVLFKEALKYSENPLSGNDTPRSLEAASLQAQARGRLKCHVLLNLTFLYCGRYSLEEATVTLESLKKVLATPGVSRSENINDLVLYLDAMLLHANGRLSDALHAYQSPRLAVKPGSFTIRTVQEQLSILATLSIILIVRAPTHPSHHSLRPLLDLMAPIFADVKSTSDAHERGLNPQLAAAYSLVLAVAHEDRWTGGSAHDNETSVLSTKKHLQTCFHVAKDMYNHLLLTAGLSFLHTQLFHGQIGEQALKSAQSAQEMAKNAGSPLWSCVSDGIAAQAYEKSGLSVEAQKAREHGEKIAQQLPVGVVELLESHSQGQTSTV